jgi:hypothetical protein
MDSCFRRNDSGGMIRISGMIILRQGFVDRFPLSQERQWENELYFGDDNSQARLG